LHARNIASDVPLLLEVALLVSAGKVRERLKSTHTGLRRFSGPLTGVSGRSLNSSRKSEFGDSSHRRISTGDVSKIATDRCF
jgi:hypothetical protein